MNDKEFLENSLLILDSYYMELKYYKDNLKLLKKYKPYFFQYKKINKYNQQVIELENKIKICENKIRNYINN